MNKKKLVDFKEEISDDFMSTLSPSRDSLYALMTDNEIPEIVNIIGKYIDFDHIDVLPVEDYSFKKLYKITAYKNNKIL